MLQLPLLEETPSNMEIAIHLWNNEQHQLCGRDNWTQSGDKIKLQHPICPSQQQLGDSIISL